MNAIEKVTKARGKKFTGKDYIDNIFSDFIEMHGDRYYGDDKAVVCGIASLCGMPVTVIAHEKGKDTKDKIKRNFGSAHPEGYRKALRQMKLAEKFSRPVVCFIDTSGAYCGIGAEERGQGRAIAESIMEMTALKTPVISILIGEGGSGGALAFASGDEVWMLENSVYSVISPEGCASILWKDSSKVADAADALKLTPSDLMENKIIERVLSESSETPEKIFTDLKNELKAAFKKLMALSESELIQKRYNRFRKIGETASYKE